MPMSKYRTPSQSPFPVFVLAQPCFVSDDIENNPWMSDATGKDAEPLDVEKFMGQWYNFYKLLSADSLVYLLPPKKGLQDLCYDERTEILTDSGWKFFKDLDKTEKVVTLNPETNEMILQTPTAYQKNSYTGNMVYFKTRLTDLMVTEDHNLYCKKNFAKYKLQRAEACVKSRVTFSTDGIWNGDEQSYFILPAIEAHNKKYHYDRKIPMDVWVKFLGWWLSEGSIYKSATHNEFRIVISQTNERYKPEIESVLQGMGLKYHKIKVGYVIYDKQLWMYLKQFGKSGDKYIPSWTKNLAKHYLHDLLLSLMKGDGCFCGTTWNYTSKSTKLLNDVQEIAIKCGYRAKVKPQTINRNTGNVIININRTESNTTKDTAALIPVNNIIVYDVTVPLYHILMVRRNGKACWSGNCYVNSFVYVAHQPEKDLIILSNFTAEGRAGEEIVAKNFLSAMGYKCVTTPFKFEGFPELKFIRDNIYFGGYGFRTDVRFHHWFEKTYDAKVIKIKEKDELQYHLDCNVFVLDDQNIILSVETTDKATLKEIEKICNVFEVEDDDAWEDICNVVRVGDLIIGASSIQSMKKSDPVYEKQKHKNDRLEEICDEMGLELMLVDLSELSKSGAACSCLATPLTAKTY